MKDPAFILDLSEGGIAVQSLAPMKHGQVVALNFQLPSTTHTIKATAKVVWHDATGRIGMEFQEISDQCRTWLKHWVQERLKNSPEEFAVPGAAELPTSVRVLSRWMKPLAVAIDSAFVLIAAAIFCLVAFLFLRGEAIFPLGVTFLFALLIGSALYSSLFWVLDVRFPGTRAVQSLLATASGRQVA